jgi:hypothetical protein
LVENEGVEDREAQGVAEVTAILTLGMAAMRSIAAIWALNSWSVRYLRTGYQLKAGKTFSMRVMPEVL